MPYFVYPRPTSTTMNGCAVVRLRISERKSRTSESDTVKPSRSTKSSRAGDAGQHERRNSTRHNSGSSASCLESWQHDPIIHMSCTMRQLMIPTQTSCGMKVMRGFADSIEASLQESMLPVSCGCDPSGEPLTASGLSSSNDASDAASSCSLCLKRFATLRDTKSAVNVLVFLRTSISSVKPAGIISTGSLWPAHATSFWVTRQ
mmetsp:Transcript_37525/g.74486  ORF Transcript_37525/g.74486 Transcript_37525/m.74486 type:complete len:204 (+) Transcript_37525:1767-2378(+)